MHPAVMARKSTGWAWWIRSNSVRKKGGKEIMAAGMYSIGVEDHFGTAVKVRGGKLTSSCV
eukprot:3312527-Pleurochrysis_carterae.AAC.1